MIYLIESNNSIIYDEVEIEELMETLETEDFPLKLVYKLGSRPKDREYEKEQTIILKNIEEINDFIRSKILTTSKDRNEFYKNRINYYISLLELKEN